MKLKKMTATFGRLECAVLELREGLNILEAPNEGGKSTWCAFLRAMFYGIPTRERDTKTALAEKNRFQPWSGSPMTGEILLTWQGRDIILRRSTKGSGPFSGFEAVYADTGDPVPGLTGENCGEILFGVGREVYQRSAFVGQSGVPIDGDPELERRIAALVSSGEEDVSFSETEKTLKTWLNRRRHNKTGLIPRLEEAGEELRGQVSRVRETSCRLAETQAGVQELEVRKQALEGEAARWKARQDWAMAEQYREALRELETTRAELASLEQEAGPLPTKERLREAQGELAYWNTLGSSIKEAKVALEQAREKAERAAEAAQDPFFEGLPPEEARLKAQADTQKAQELPNTRNFLMGGILLLLASGLFLAAAGFWSNVNFLAAGVPALFTGVVLLLQIPRRKKEQERKKQSILSSYSAKTVDDISARALAYQEHCAAAAESFRQVTVVDQSLQDLTSRREQLQRDLLAFVRPFAPAVTDSFGLSAALSRALSLDERLATARVKEEAARKLVSSLPAPVSGLDKISREAPPPPLAGSTAQQVSTALFAVSSELSRLQSELSHAQGQQTVQGDQAELEAELDQTETRLAQRRAEYDAIALALEVLSEANGELRSRFSPDLNRLAGEYFSALTGGRYESVNLSREFEATARETGEVLPRRSLFLSAGTVNQLYLAVRLAVCKLALPSEDGGIPLVLDDALSEFDDGRLALALDVLQTLSHTRQILLFTCQSREKALLQPS